MTFWHILWLKWSDPTNTVQTFYRKLIKMSFSNFKTPTLNIKHRPAFFHQHFLSLNRGMFCRVSDRRFYLIFDVKETVFLPSPHPSPPLSLHHTHPWQKAHWFIRSLRKSIMVIVSFARGSGSLAEPQRGFFSALHIHILFKSHVYVQIDRRRESEIDEEGGGMPAWSHRLDVTL